MSSMTEYSVCPPTSIVGSAAAGIPIWPAPLRTARGWRSRCRPSAAFRAFPHTTACNPPRRLPATRTELRQHPDRASAGRTASPTGRAVPRRDARPPPPGRRHRRLHSSPTHGSSQRVRTRRRRDRARCGRRQGDNATRQRAPRAPERPSHQRSDAPPVHRPVWRARRASGCGPLGKNPSRSTGFWIRKRRSAV